MFWNKNSIICLSQINRPSLYQTELLSFQALWGSPALIRGPLIILQATERNPQSFGGTTWKKESGQFFSGLSLSWASSRWSQTELRREFSGGPCICKAEFAKCPRGLGAPCWARKFQQAASTSATVGGNANRIILYNLINGAGLLEVKGDGEKFSDLPGKLYSRCL